MSNGMPKLPSASALSIGEIAINFAEGYETLSIKNNNNGIASFSSDNINDKKYISSGNVVSAISAHTGDTSLHLPSVTSSDNGKVMKVVNGEWVTVDPVVVYSGTETPPPALGNNGDIYLQTAEALQKPDIIYQTDGTTGLLGHNANTYEGNWQLENLDLTPYKFIKCYFKATSSTDSSKYTPAVVVEVPLDTAAKGTNIYTGGQMVALPFNRNRQYFVTCAVDSTKTKFQVVHQNTIWDVTASDANSEGRYLYKIEGWY